MEIIPFLLGPLGNNSYLISDSESGEAAVIDPAFDPAPILDYAAQKNWQILSVWLTHAHFDHIAGVLSILQAASPAATVALHPADLPLWQEKGGARLFGYQVEPGPLPTRQLQHQQILRLGAEQVEVRHTPGHSPGHVVFYSAAAGAVLCGDLIFRRSVGRTDLPGASARDLAASIRAQIYTLPRSTRLLPGHGPETTVGEEADHNPYV